MDYSKKLAQFANIKHFFSSKIDGNLAFHVDDDEKNVLKNHKNLAKKHSYNCQKLVHMKQIHSNEVHIIKPDDNFSNPPTCDALITNKKDTPLMVMVADCSPVLFYDDVQKVIAVAHVGRAGAFKNIIKNVIDEFKNFGSKSSDITVAIGSNIKSCCYEVREDVWAQNEPYLYAKVKKDGKSFLDIDLIIKTQLRELGVLNAQFVGSCTCCSSIHYSYRAKPQTGRFAGVIWLV